MCVDAPKSCISLSFCGFGFRVVTRRIHSPMMCELGGQSGHQWNEATRWLISTWFGKESMVPRLVIVDVMDSVYIYIHYGIYIYDNCIYTKYTICWIVHHLVQSLWYYIWVLKMNIWETNWGFMVCSCFKCLVIWRNVISSAMWQCVHVSVN